MIDRFSRTINYLRVSVTDRCNLRCRYCMPKEGLSLLGHADILSYEEILRVARAAISAGIVKVRVTGGEPLVRRGLIPFLASLSDTPGLSDLSITTNGILLEDCAEDLYAAGVGRINVSLDSLQHEKYRDITRGGDLRRALRGIERCRVLGFNPIKINVVVIRGFNDSETLDFASLAYYHPYHVRFIEFMPVGNAALEIGGSFISNDEIMEKINDRWRLEEDGPNRRIQDGPARTYRLKDGKGKVGFISAMSHQFCTSCNRLRLTADGNLRACLMDDREVNIKALIRNGANDRALEEEIRKVIADKPMGPPEDLCPSRRKKCARPMSTMGG
ncbi:MAG: GTP 3',8-cyclase MoaA [Deltaproteobacteria bacterium]|nr:GTP 3',8-cyclase MoaA [Deltaproteobacteria bacterium]